MSFKSAYRGGGYERATREHLYVDPASISAGAAFKYVVLVLLGGYFVIHHLDLFPTLPLTQLAWNFLVYVTPPSLVIALENRATRLSSVDNPQSYAKTQSFAAKSEAMRSILGLSVGGRSHATARSRSLGGMFKHTTADSLPGLGNWDNSCYQNSILQGLSSIPSLRAFLEQTDRGIPGAALRPTNLALSGLIEELNNPKNYGQKFWTPPVLKSMSSWQQQDAQEYYSKVIDALEKELGKGLAIQIRVKGLESSPPEAKTSEANEHESRNDSLAHNPLEGMLAQRVGCLRCGYVEGLSLIPFNCITVPLGNRSMYDLAECLDEYTGLEPINGVECPHCTLLRQKEILQKLTSLGAQNSTVSNTSAKPSQEPPIGAEPSQDNFSRRLSAVNTALEEGDFSDETLSKKCSISSKQRVLSTKTRQAVIARQPHALAVHVNRSLFDEYTGFLQKNYATVRFPKFLDLSRWSLGGFSDETERWSSNPAQSILDAQVDAETSLEVTTSRCQDTRNSIYALRAVITHQGRHENGHYIAYRKNWPSGEDVGVSRQSWWRLSDEDVTATNEEAVLAQGGVFMLFYEQGTKKEQEEYIQSLKGSQITQSKINSSEKQASASALADPGIDSALLRPSLDLDGSPPKTPAPDIRIPLRASSNAQHSVSPSSPLQSMISDITPQRRSSLQASPASKSKGKAGRKMSPTKITTSPSKADHGISNMEEPSPPVIPERKASKMTKRGKKPKEIADSPRAVHMRTSVASDGGSSSALGSPQPGMVSAQ